MKTYLKFLSRNKLYTAIEFIGLSVALAFVIISFCYVMQQYAVTRENPDRERIYAVGPDRMTLLPEFDVMINYEHAQSYAIQSYRDKPFNNWANIVTYEFFEK